MTDIYSKLSKERKKLQKAGEIPPWYTTSAYQMFKDKYQHENATVKETFQRIANTAASHLKAHNQDVGTWSQKFFELLWNGWLSPSTPVLSNMGTNKGLAVSCSGGYVGDSIDDFYKSYHEVAMLTKFGFGTSGYLGDIRPRGTKISRGGKASGVKPVFEHFIHDMRAVSQGSSRRGAFAGYIEIDHADFDELSDLVLHEPDDANIGWIIKDSFIKRLNEGDIEATRRYQKALKLKMVTGKGYFLFIDKANRNRPQCYKDNNLDIKMSNLCNEILLFCDKDHSFTCVLSSMNLFRYDEWKDTDAVFNATVFLDCVAEDLLVNGSDIPGLEKAIRFTRKGRALGLGACGFHSYVQNKGWAFEGLETHLWNIEAFKKMDEESLKATQWMAKEFGEPEWCKGYGIRNTHRIAIPPTKTNSLIQGGVSEGINPDPALVYTQATSAGEVDRIAPIFLELLKKKGKYTKEVLDDIIQNNGSIQHVDWMTDEEKLVFRTAFEIDQKVVLRLAATRAKYLDQWQSLNLFFSAEEDEKYISEVHQEAFMDERILGLYYVYSLTGVKAAKNECIACQ